jgi:hypothetical protein
MVGLSLDHAWIKLRFSWVSWIMVGLCLDYVWIKLGLCLGLAWILLGYTWIIVGLNLD